MNWGTAEAGGKEVCSSLGLGLILLLNALLSSKVFLTLSNNWILEMDLSEIPVFMELQKADQ
jgi:hypothetical protein